MGCILTVLVIIRFDAGILALPAEIFVLIFRKLPTQNWRDLLIYVAVVTVNDISTDIFVMEQKRRNIWDLQAAFLRDKSPGISVDKVFSELKNRLGMEDFTQKHHKDGESY